MRNRNVIRVVVEETSIFTGEARVRDRLVDGTILGGAIRTDESGATAYVVVDVDRATYADAASFDGAGLRWYWLDGRG